MEGLCLKLCVATKTDSMIAGVKSAATLSYCRVESQSEAFYEVVKHQDEMTVIAKTVTCSYLLTGELKSKHECMNVVTSGFALVSVKSFSENTKDGWHEGHELIDSLESNGQAFIVKRKPDTDAEPGLKIKENLLTNWCYSTAENEDQVMVVTRAHLNVCTVDSFSDGRVYVKAFK